MTDKQLNDLVELAHAHLEGRLTAEQREALEAAIEAGGESRRIVADLLHDHACLYWDHMGQPGEAESIENFSGGGAAVPPKAGSGEKHPVLRPLAIAAALAVAALGAGLFIGSQTGRAAAFATLVHADAATWGGGSLPTANGSRLAQGQLRLEEGLATVRFDSGATVTLEAPAVFELIDAMNAVLAGGTVVADVPESAHGFRIQTPSARVVDHGTRFAVNVESATGATRTHVFEGLVEVEHPQTSKIVQLRTGEQNRVEGDQLDPVSQGPAEGAWAPRRTVARGREWRLISTREGRGKDGYVSAIPTDHRSDIQLLVKSTEQKRGPRRKAYLGFDLTGVAREQIETAELILNFEPTGWGLASALPDCEFEVYGLTQEALESWSPGDLAWANAPANVLQGNRVDATAAKLLGSFIVPRGVQKGEFILQTTALRDFLRADANGQVTLILFRKTLEKDDGGLVHGVASSRHPTLPAPTLAIKMQEAGN